MNWCVTAVTDAPLDARTMAALRPPTLLSMSLDQKEHTMKVRFVAVLFTLSALAAALAPIAGAAGRWG